MKKLLIIMLLALCLPSFAEENTTSSAVQNPLTVPQNINYENCTKIYNVSQEKLFYLVLASVSANRFKVEEIQSAYGYIIFTASREKYILTVAKIDKSNSVLKVTPCNNLYNFPPGIITNLYKYIDMNLETK